ncbi:MAG: hypothetical protein R2855_05755 [Thermomicrobiales bacterium]
MAEAMERDMRNRFFVSFLLTIPIILLSMLGETLFGLESFEPFGITQLVDAGAVDSGGLLVWLDVHRWSHHLVKAPHVEHECPHRRRRHGRVGV